MESSVRRTFFSNKIFFYFLVGCIAVFLLWNLFVFISTLNIYLLIPVLFQLVLLVLILTRDKYARTAIIIWAIVLIIAPSLELLADVMDLGNNLLDNDFKGLDVYNIIYFLALLVGGILVLDFTRRTVKVKYPVNTELKDVQP